MREIKFRGKGIDDGKWYFGFVAQAIPETSETYIMPHEIYNAFEAEEYPNRWTLEFENYKQVDPETVGQLRFNNSCGQDIFEGDILARDGYWNMVVEHHRVYPLDKVQRFNSTGISIDEFEFDYWTVSGNVHDTPQGA